MPSLTLELSQKTPKNYVSGQIFKHSLNFEPLPPLISGLNSKFDYATLCVLNWSLVSQNFVLKSYLYQKLSRKTLGGVGLTPLLDQEGFAFLLNLKCQPTSRRRYHFCRGKYDGYYEHKRNNSSCDHCRSPWSAKMQFLNFDHKWKLNFQGHKAKNIWKCLSCRVSYKPSKLDG